MTNVTGENISGVLETLLKLDYVFALLSPAKLNIFHANPNYNLKNRCYSKIILGHPVFQLLFASYFFLQLFVS